MSGVDTKELEKVLRLCTKLGVSEIKFGDVHVIFGNDPQVINRKPRKAMIREQEQTEQQSFFQDEADRVSDEIGISHIENPVEFEEAVSRGLLVDDQSRSTAEQH